MGAVEEWQEERDYDNDGADGGTGDLFAPVRVADGGDDRLDERKGGADTDEHDGGEEQNSPESGRGHFRDGQWVCQEADSKGSELVALFRLQAEEANDAKDGEGTDNFEERVGAGDNDGVLDSVGKGWIVRCECCEVAETNTGGEEDLTSGSLPDLTGSQLWTVPVAHVQLDAVNSVGERYTAAEEDENDDNRHAHGEIYNAARQTNTLEHAKIHNEPDKGNPADSLADKANVWVTGICRHRAIVIKCAGNGGCISDDILHVKFLSSAVPGQWGIEGVAEVDHDPTENGHIVGCNHITRHDGANTHSPRPFADSIEGNDTSTTGSLANRDLKNEERNCKKDEGDQVWEEPLQAIVLENNRRVSQDVSETNSAAHGRKHKGSPRRPLVTAIRRFFCVRSDDTENLLEDVHVWRSTFLTKRSVTWGGRSNAECGKGGGGEKKFQLA